MTYLLDSNTVIEVLKGTKREASFIAVSINSGLSISVITYGEVLEGLLHPQRGSETQQARFNALLASMNVLDVRLEEVQHYARIRLDLRMQGMLIPDNDIWIAATAMANDLQLVSGDQHFQRIQGLRVYSL